MLLARALTTTKQPSASKEQNTFLLQSKLAEKRGQKEISAENTPQSNASRRQSPKHNQFLDSSYSKVGRVGDGLEQENLTSEFMMVQSQINGTYGLGSSGKGSSHAWESEEEKHQTGSSKSMSDSKSHDSVKARNQQGDAERFNRKYERENHDQQSLVRNREQEEKAKRLKEQEQQLLSRERQLSAQQAQMRQREEEVTKREKEMIGKEAQVAVKEKQLQQDKYQMKRIMHQKQDELSELQSQFEKRAKTSDNLANTIRELKDHLESVEKQAKKALLAQSMIQTLNKEIQDLQTDKESLTYELLQQKKENQSLKTSYEQVKIEKIKQEQAYQKLKDTFEDFKQEHEHKEMTHHVNNQREDEVEKTILETGLQVIEQERNSVPISVDPPAQHPQFDDLVFLSQQVQQMCDFHKETQATKKPQTGPVTVVDTLPGNIDTSEQKDEVKEADSNKASEDSVKRHGSSLGKLSNYSLAQSTQSAMSFIQTESSYRNKLRSNRLMAKLGRRRTRNQ